MNDSTTATDPVLVTAGELRFRLERTVLEIARALRDEVTPGSIPPGLSQGDAGLAALYAALEGQWPGEGWGKRARAHWSAAADRVAREPSSSSLFSGFPGVAWTALQIRDPVLPDAGSDLLDEIDDVLAALLDRDDRENYDLVSGLVGWGVYLADRLPDRRAAAGLERIVHLLECRAIARDDGLTWRTPPELLPEDQRREAPAGYFNLGLAHGVPGIVALLGRIISAECGGPSAVTLLEGAVRWVLAQEIEGARGLRYPGWIVAGPPRGPARPTRVAWCYGDLGIAAAIIVAGTATGRDDWTQAGLRMARRVAAVSFEASSVVDTGICHGSAGVAHLFHRLARSTGDWVLADASRHWLRHTLRLRRREGIAGFPARRREPGGSAYWSAEPGLLEGAAGVALVLLSAVTGRSPDWDRLLLISAPPREAA